ncbi:MAG TPA: hypothetical protein VGM92_13670 [Candidatus Kapabacteria bacterium]
MLLLCAWNVVYAQHPTPLSSPSEETATYLFASIGGFIPTSEGYRLNFSNRFLGLPIEISGGLMVPIGTNLFLPITVRYDRRVADFVTASEVDVTSIEPGIRYFFGDANLKEFRLFIEGELILADASMTGMYDVTGVDNTGQVIAEGTARTQHDYYNVGAGLDLGISYPLSATTALDASVHYAFFVASTIASGGLGDIGGVSIAAGYRLGF